MLKYISLVLLLALGSTNNLYGMDLAAFDALQTRRLEMESKEQELSQKRSLLLELNKRVAVLRNVQGKMLLGSNGLVAQTNNWTKQADQWLSSWSDLLDAAELNDSSVNSQSTAQLSKLFDTFEKSYAELIKSNSQLVFKIDDLHSLLASLDDLPTEAYPSMGSKIADLNAQKSELSRITANLSKNIGGMGADQYQERVQNIRSYIFARTSLAKMKFPQLKTALLEFEETLEFETIFRGKLGELSRLTAETQESITGIKQFKAQSDFERLTQRKNQIIAELTQPSVPTRLSQSFVEKIESDYLLIRRSFENFKDQFPGRAAIIRFAEKQRVLMTKQCSKAEARMQLDCELLRTLNQVKIDEESVKSLSDADLRYLENQIIKVRSSAGVGAAAK